MLSFSPESACEDLAGDGDDTARLLGWIERRASPRTSTAPPLSGEFDGGALWRRVRGGEEGGGGPSGHRRYPSHQDDTGQLDLSIHI